MFLEPFDIEDDLADQTRGYLAARVVFGRVSHTQVSLGWEELGDFAINIAFDDLTYTDVPIANPNPVVNNVRAPAASVGDTVMLLQFIDGTIVCLGRVNV